MTTGLTVIQFDNFFKNNYVFLNREVKKYSSTSDLLHDVYLNLRIKITGITITSTVTGYFLKCLKNAWLNNLKKEVRTIEIELVDENQIVDDFSNNQEYYNQLDNYSRYLFKFVESRFSEKQVHVYKSYFLTDSTYKELADRCGYSYSTVEQYVQKINRDIKQNFNGWLEKELIGERSRKRLKQLV